MNILFWYLWHFKFTDSIQILMLLRAAATSHSSGLQATKLNSTDWALRNLETKVAWGKPWNLIRWCGSPHVTSVFWGKIFGVKWEIFTFRGEKQKKAVESTASSATSGVLEGDVWEVSFPSWGRIWLMLTLILFLAFTLWSLWHPRMTLPIFWGTEQP